MAYFLLLLDYVKIFIKFQCLAQNGNRQGLNRTILFQNINDFLKNFQRVRGLSLKSKSFAVIYFIKRRAGP